MGDFMGVPGSNPGGSMIFLLVELLQTEPIHRIGGELRIFSQLRISDRLVDKGDIRERD